MFNRRHKKSNNLLSVYAQEVRENVEEIISGERAKRRRQRLAIANYFVWLLVVIVLLLVASLAALYPSAKQVYRNALVLRDEFRFLDTELHTGSSEAVQTRLARMSNEADDSLEALRRIKYSPVSWLSQFNTRLSDGENLLLAAKSIIVATQGATKVGDAFYRLLPESRSLNFKNMSRDDKRALLDVMLKGRTYLPQANKDLQYAESRIKAISDTEFFWQYGINIEDINNRLNSAKNALELAAPMSELLPAFAGYPGQANYLFVFQNSNELRPTGGFIGTYGLAVADSGELKRFDTHDVYHLDLPIKDKYQQAPPEPLKKYLGQNYWYFRDGNWQANWPDAAENLMKMYDDENSLQAKPDELKKFDFVIALTPAVVVDLLRWSGPVDIRGEHYTADNFTELLQTNTEKDFEKLGFSRWERKQVVGEIAKVLEDRLLSDLRANWKDIAEILNRNLQNKNILIWARDSGIAQYAADKNWDGHIASTEGDYLYVVDANLHALKTDAVLNRNITYQLSETEQGLLAKVNVNYAHLGKSADWKTSDYRTFTRIYVPKGAKLAKIAGFMGPEADIKQGEEYGKTWFGAFTSVEMGKIGGLYFEYYLPYNLWEQAKKGSYSFTLQKQPGVSSQDTYVDLNFKTPIKSYEPASLGVSKIGGRIIWRGEMDGDKLYRVKF